VDHKKPKQDRPDYPEEDFDIDYLLPGPVSELITKDDFPWAEERDKALERMRQWDRFKELPRLDPSVMNRRPEEFHYDPRVFKPNPELLKDLEATKPATSYVI
jgi:hypothetical protein